ncbi:MAG: gamma-glutamyltransferase [Proteobacteria bacterium]|nr:gamma-glutamyltransferase [Pseudomonadota bacterium]
MSRLLLLLLVFAFGCATPAAEPETAAPTPKAPTPAPPPSVTAGAVASAHPLATAAGEAMLRRGGTAFDAAVATALVLGVANPQSSGLGGGGFAVYKTSAGVVSSLDFREMAPSFFTADMYADGAKNSQRGGWATGIPGEPMGLAELHALGGVLPWADVVEPARTAAADGFPVGPDLASALARHTDKVVADPGLKAVFAPEGTILAEGELCTRPSLAETLAYLQAHGGAALYKGPLAISIAGFLAGEGVPWTEAEFAAYTTRERPVLSTSYRGHTIHAMGPPSSGGLAIVQITRMLEAREHHAMAHGSTEWTRTLASAMSHAFADRATYGGDPDFSEVPVEALMAEDLTGKLLERTPEAGPVPLLEAGWAGITGDSKVLLNDDGGTSHLSVLDAHGNAVALTTTVNLAFGSMQADPGTGLVFNDEMDDFAARPGQPNAFGLVQGEANAPAPGKRPLSSMSPTLVTDADGKVVLAVGAAGGPIIITSTLQTLLGVTDRGLSASEALALPRIHHQWLPEMVFVEAGIDAATRDALTAEGFVFQERGHLATAQAVTFDPATSTFDAGADPRAGGAGAVVASE